MADFATETIHASARARAMKSRLFNRAQFEDLLDQDELSTVIEVLLASEYKAEMAEALTRYKGADAVEEAVSRNLVRTFQRVLASTSGNLYPLTRYFIARWDLVAVKSLLRSRHRGITAEPDGGVLFPGPTLGTALLRDLAQCESMTALVQRLAAWNPQLCRCLLSFVGEPGKEPALDALENALDRNYLVDRACALTGATDEDSRILRRFLRVSIDGVNLHTLLRIRQTAADREEVRQWLLPEGALPNHIVEKMLEAPNAAEAMALLGETAYREFVEGLYQFLQTGRFSPLERMFELTLMNELKRMARRHVCSLAVIMHYCWLKYNEVINLRLIARGEARHLPRGRVREELVYG